MPIAGKPILRAELTQARLLGLSQVTVAVTLLTFFAGFAQGRTHRPRPRRLGFSLTLGGNTFRIWGVQKTGVMPKGTSVSPDGKRIYVTNFGRRRGHNLDVLDGLTFKTLRKVDFPGNTIESVVSPDSRTLYVTNYYGWKVQALDTTTWKVRWEKKVGRFPKMMTLTKDGKWLYVTAWASRTVHKIDAQTGDLKGSVKTGRNARGVSVSPDGRTLYVANVGTKHVSVVDTQTMRVTATIRTGSAPRHTALSKDGSRLYVSCIGGSSLYVIDTAKRAVIKVVYVAASPRTIELSRDERFLYVVSFAGHAMTIVDTKTFQTKILLLDIVKGSGLAVHPTDRFIYITGWCTKDIWAIERLKPGVAPGPLGPTIRRPAVFRDPKIAWRLDCPMPAQMYRSWRRRK